MVDLLYYSCPLITIGALAGLIFPDQPAAVLSAQVVYVGLYALGIGAGALLRGRAS
jgi:hypothetical protein